MDLNARLFWTKNNEVLLAYKYLIQVGGRQIMKLVLSKFKIVQDPVTLYILITLICKFL